MTIVAIIPARGGSKRIPRKNIRDFYGTPIIAYSIETALRSRMFDNVIVSTDDDEIAKISITYGASIYSRPKDDGRRGTQDVARDVVMSDDRITMACVIYATSPMLVPADLSRGLAVLEPQTTKLFAMSVQPDPLADAGCFYWCRAEALRVNAPLIDSHTLMVPMPARRVCDINTEDDWKRAERMYAEWRGVRG